MQLIKTWKNLETLKTKKTQNQDWPKYISKSEYQRQIKVNQNILFCDHISVTFYIHIKNHKEE